MLLSQILRHPPPHLRQRAPHNPTEIPLILRIQRNNTRLMRSDNRLTSLHHARRRLQLQFIRNQQQQERPLQQINPKEKGHEFEAGVKFQNVADCFSCGDGVPCRGDEALTADPQIVVIEEVDGVPFAGEEDVQDVHDVGPVGHDNAGLDVALCHAAGAGVAAVDALDGWGADVVRDVIGGGDTGCFGGLFIGCLGLCVEAEMALFEFLEALLVCLEVAGDFGGLVVPLARGAEANTEAGVVSGVVEVDNLAEDGHQGEKVSKDAVTGALKRWPPAPDGLRGIRIRSENAGISVGVEVAILVVGVVHGLEKPIAFNVEKEEWAIVAQRKVAVYNVDKPPDTSPLLAFLLGDNTRNISHFLFILSIRIHLIVLVGIHGRSVVGQLPPKLQLPRQ